MCLNTPNLRFLFNVRHSHLKMMKKANAHGKVSPRELQVRDSIVQHAMKQFCPEQLCRAVYEGKRRSDSSEEKLIADFMSFEQPFHPVVRDFHYKRALAKTKLMFQPSRLLKPIAFPDQVYYPWRTDVSAEAPWTIKPEVEEILRRKQREGDNENDRKSFGNLYDEIFEENRNLVHLIKMGDSAFWESDGTPKPYYWVNLHARAHVVDQDKPDKIRAVFGVPKLLLQCEQTFIWPLMTEYLNSGNSPMLWGNEIMKGGWKKLYRSVEDGKVVNTVLSLDWSEFDKRALHEVIDDVHDIWRSYFTFEEGYQPTIFYPETKTPPESLERLWYWTTYMVKNYPICLPDGRVFKWNHNGIASGFQETQLLDSFVNTIMLLTILSRTGVNINSPNFWMKVQGDDSLIALPERKYELYGKSYLDDLSKYAKTYFNAKLSTDKSFITNSLNGSYVLGYHNKYGIAYRQDDDLLAHLYFPERPQRLSALASSAIGIAMSSMGCSEIVYSVCKDIFDFITQKLNVEPSPSALDWMVRAMLVDSEIEIPKVFPSFEEIRGQQYAIPTRTENQKQRLWPTKPEPKRGFFFLP